MSEKANCKRNELIRVPDVAELVLPDGRKILLRRWTPTDRDWETR